MRLFAVLAASLLLVTSPLVQAGEPEQLRGHPAWARSLGERYLLGQTAVFILHGNVDDLQSAPEEGGRHSYEMLPGYLTRNLFGTRELVLLYDPVGGIRGVDAPTEADLKKALAEKLQGLTTLPRAPAQALPWLNDYLHRRAKEQRSLALIILDADAVVPSGEWAQLSEADRQAVAQLRRWATAEPLVNADVSVVLVSRRLKDVAAPLTREPQVGVYELPLPSEQERLDFVLERLRDPALAAWVRLPAQRVAKLTEGFLLRDLSAMLAQVLRTRTPLTEQSIAKLKPTASPKP